VPKSFPYCVVAPQAGLLTPVNSCLQRIAQTTAVEEAERWLKLAPGIEGVVAKRNDSRYLPGHQVLAE
jgi:hypothetical protein